MHVRIRKLLGTRTWARAIPLKHGRHLSTSVTLPTLTGKKQVLLAGLSDNLSKSVADSPQLASAVPINSVHSLQKARSSGLLVYLDASDDSSHGDSSLLANVEDNYDLRVLVEDGMTANEIASKVARRVGQDQRFVSTRSDIKDQENPVFFHETVRRGLAPDGGLYFPVDMPEISLGELERMVPLSYEERALRILEKFPLSTMQPAELRGMLKQAYSTFADPTNPLPLSHLENNQYLLEEYHGPTASFKDLALQLTPQLFRSSVKHSGEDDKAFLLLAATSGDTGSAALHGFANVPNVPVVVLFPKGGVSPIQQAQMVSCPGDVCVISIESDFDYCQALVKDIFNNNTLREELNQAYGVSLTSGNSINWGRLFPQIPYTFNAYLELVKMGALRLGDSMDLCVPTGNFGNMLGGVIAKRMGLPVQDLVVACNENNILADWIQSGDFDKRGRSLHKTISPSIDILLPSNLERYLYLMTDRDHTSVATWFTQFSEAGHFTLPGELHSTINAALKADWATGTESSHAIRDVYDRTKFLLDPHTAVGKVVADKVSGSHSERPMVIASTAHYAKFPQAALKALDMTEPDPDSMQLPELVQRLNSISSKTGQHPEIESIANLPVLHTIDAPADPEVVVQHIRDFLSRRGS